MSIADALTNCRKDRQIGLGRAAGAGAGAGATVISYGTQQFSRIHYTILRQLSAKIDARSCT